MIQRSEVDVYSTKTTSSQSIVKIVIFGSIGYQALIVSIDLERIGNLHEQCSGEATLVACSGVIVKWGLFPVAGIENIIARIVQREKVSLEQAIAIESQQPLPRDQLQLEIMTLCV